MAQSQGDAGPASRGTPDYRSARVLALGASRWVGVQTVLAAVILAVDLREHAVLGGSTPDLDAADGLDSLNVILSLAQVAFYLVAILLVIAWLYRAYGQIQALGIKHPRYGRGWAIGSWFVPLLNLVRPLELVFDVWRAGGDDEGKPATHWQQRRVSPLLGFWWAAWLTSGIAANFAFRADTDTVEALRSSLIADAVAQGLAIPAGVLLILVIRRATARQDRRAAELATGTDPVAAPA